MGKSKGSKEWENYSKNNDGKKIFFHGNLEKKNKKNNYREEETSRKNKEGKLKTREQEQELIVNNARNLSKKYEKEARNDHELEKLEKGGLKKDWMKQQEVQENSQISTFFRKSYMQ